MTKDELFTAVKETCLRKLDEHENMEVLGLLDSYRTTFMKYGFCLGLLTGLLCGTVAFILQVYLQ